LQDKEKTNWRSFDEEFKRRAVEMIERGERSACQLNKELGVSEWSLCQWKKHYRKGRYRPRTTQSRHDHPIAPNRLLSTEGVAQVAAEQTWVADITYLPTGEGWHYLAAEMNLGSPRIMGWKSASSMESALVEGAFQRAAFSSSNPPKLHHSDRGSQYAAKSFRSLLDSLIPSMSRRANCYDNATMESFWSTLKTECFHAGPPATRAQADRMIFDYIETFYNTRRLHSSLGYQSPADYEKSLITSFQHEASRHPNPRIR